MTFDASSANVLAPIPPHPRSKDRAITLPFVPGGPEPSTNGLSNFMPLTVMLRSVTSPPGWTPGKPETAGLAQADSAIQHTFIGAGGHRHIHLTGHPTGRGATGRSGRDLRINAAARRARATSPWPTRPSPTGSTASPTIAPRIAT